MIEICPDRQRLLDCEGHALVIGGPGSGKTTIALKKAVKRIGEGLAPGQSVLFLSFSRAAVARIGEASKTEVKKNHRGLLDIQTFHSFFWELLRAHAYLLGTPKRLKILLPHDERALSNGAKEGELLWPAWISERERLCREDGRIAFDLFAPMAAMLFERSLLLRKLIAQRYPLVIVDEAQDTNPDAWRCIELLAQHTKVICLADLDQQIFDYLPGIDPKRIAAIELALNPLKIDLGLQNHRSPGSEIAVFGRDILVGNARGVPYRGVSKLPYNPNPKTFDQAKTIRIALGVLQNTIKKATGDWGRSIAILLPSGFSAAKVSSAMNSAENPIRHKLLFDEAEAMLAARFSAFMLEPPQGSNPFADLGIALELYSEMKRASGVAEAKTVHDWAVKVRSGKVPRAGFVIALQSVLKDLKSEPLSGDPVKDWTKVKKASLASGDAKLTQIVKRLDYLVAFNRGKRIATNLSEMWQRDGQYTGARQALELALTQDQLLDGIDDPNGVQVMTIHKAKGKQFDGVIVVRECRHDGTKYASSFVWRNDVAPYYRSRKILHVAVTRAKVHTLILDPAFPKCPIIGPYNL